MSEPTQPEVWARPAEAAEIPSRARVVVKAGTTAGWDVRVTYARGTWAFPKKPPAVVDSVLVRLSHPDGRRAAAHWLDGGFDDAYVWNGSTVYLRKVGANNLKVMLSAGEWVAEQVEPAPLHERVAEAASLLRPVVAGSWGTVHAGDVVRGADQRPWQVDERGPALRWAIGGDSADFTMSNVVRGEVTVRRKLSDPCDVMGRADHTATAAAVGALIEGGLGVEIQRESAAPRHCPTCYPGGFSPGTFDGPKRDCPTHGEPQSAEPCTYLEPGGCAGSCVGRECWTGRVLAERPCDDPFCGPGGCGWAPAEHMAPAATTPKERARTNERTPVGDEFQSAVPAVKFDRFGRYLLPDPTTGKERAWTRVSTVAGTLADTYNLTQWKMRMVAKGVAIRPDLVAGAAAADPEHDKKDLQEIAGKAMDAAEAGAGATFGTALHNFTRRLDLGSSVEALHAPPYIVDELNAYVDCFRRAHLAVTDAERIVVLPELGIAGEFDRRVTQPSGVTKSAPASILDLKTGKDLSYGWLEIVIQQALYANAPLMWDPATGTYVEKPAVDLARALILHLPIGKRTATLYGVNIAEGWRLAKLAMQVRAERSGAKKLAWLVTPDDPATVALHLVTTAATQGDLAILWDRYNKAGLWSTEVDAAAHARMAQLQQLATV